MSPFVEQAAHSKTFAEIKKDLGELKEPRFNLAGIPLTASPLIALALARALDTGAPVILAPDELQQRALRAAWQAVTSSPLMILRPLPPDFTDAEVLNREPELLLLAQLLALNERTEAGAILLANTLYDDLPSPETVLKRSISLVLDDEIKMEDLHASLVDLVYERVEQVDAAGQFAWRGDILDISLADPFEEEPYLVYRVSFFDTQIDSIRRVNPDTQRSIEELERVVIPPARVLLFAPGERAELAGKIRSRVKTYRQNRIRSGAKPDDLRRLEELALRDAERLEEGFRFAGLARWQMLLKRPQFTVLDYVKAAKRPLFCVDLKQTMKRLDAFQSEWRNELERGLVQGRFLPEAEALYLSRNEVGRRLDQMSQKVPLISLQQLSSSQGAFPQAGQKKI